MNAIDILGSLLGAPRSGGGRPSSEQSSGDRSRGTASGGGIGDILGDLLGGGSSSDNRPINTQASARELEDMLNVGQEPRTTQSQPQSRSAPPVSPSRPGLPPDIFGQRQRVEPKISLSVPKPVMPSQNDQAVLLIRSMINAAKIDGEITEEEQQSILSQVGDTNPETIQFLRAEFARPLNVEEFAASIPIGLEHKIYGIGLMAIKLDSREEADYLRQLAKHLRISPEECNQLHQQQKAPLLYQ